MFKEFEEAKKEGGASSAGGDGKEDPQMMSFLDKFAKELMNPESGGEGGAGLDKMMAEFTNFLKDSEGNDDMKSALDQVVTELLNKDTLYEPMKMMRQQYPKWLEENWDKVPQKDVEMYNEQLDKIIEICEFYEKIPSPTADQQTQVFELLHQLQELGSPPDELMRKIQAKQMGGKMPSGMPFGM